MQAGARPRNIAPFPRRLLRDAIVIPVRRPAPGRGELQVVHGTEQVRVEPVFSRSSSERCASSSALKRADPKKTTVSWMRSRRKRASGSEYSARMRIRRPSAPFRKLGFSYARGAIPKGRWIGKLVCHGETRISLRFTIVNRVRESNPQIQKTYAGNDAANHSKHCYMCQLRRVIQQSVVLPKMGPGKQAAPARQRTRRMTTRRKSSRR